MTTRTATAQPLCVLAADEDPDRLDDLTAALKRLGHDVALYAVRVDQVATVVGHSDPDVAIVALHEDDEHALDLIEEISECASGPVIVALEGDDAEFVARPPHGASTPPCGRSARSRSRARSRWPSAATPRCKS